MLGFTAEQATAAIIAALIAFAGVVLGQIVGAVLGARYGANLTRKTQLELADLAFYRTWRESLVRPFLDLAISRVAALADFSEAAAVGNFDRALAIAHARTRTDVVAGTVTFWHLDGMEDLRTASDAWVRAEYEIAKRTAAIADRQNYEPGDTQLMLDSLVDLVAATARLQDAAGRFVASGPQAGPKRHWWRFRKLRSRGAPLKPPDRPTTEPAAQN